MKSPSSESSPAKIIAGSFLAAIVAGTVLLMLPGSSAREPLRFIDALFTATSAVCVTGHTVVDTGGDLTRFGQTIVLALIQVGGLGLMTFSLFFLFLFRVRTSFSARLAVSSFSQDNDIPHLFRALAFTLAMTASFEVLGAILMYPVFAEDLAVGEAIFYSVFHAVSAFCNAGFSLYSDSLVRFQNRPIFLSVFMALIVAGGLGFIVVDEIRLWMKARLQGTRFLMSLHSRVCLSMTAIFLTAGTAIFWLLERPNQLDGMRGFTQFYNAVFLSVTCRTAGFNTLPTELLTTASLFILILLMFVGGCPGSAAGGVKLTTVAVLAALVRGQMKGHGLPNLFRRKFSPVVVGKSLSVFAAGIVIVIIVTLGLELTENLGLSFPKTSFDFMEILFDTTSAFGTVGLSMGVMPTLSDLGKSLVVLTMFVGRIGPLTLGLAILARRKKQLHYEYVEDDVLVG